MKTYKVTGPSGPMETMAPSAKKAEANFRWRLVNEYGMSWYQATRYDLSDMSPAD